MTNIIISDIKDELILYFDTKDKSINAYTLASTLVALADSAKEANRIINPGYEVEIIVTALEQGSFKAIVKTVFKEVKNLFSAESARAIILSIIAAMLYDKYFAQKQDIVVTINIDTVIVSSQDERMVMPREIYDEKEKLKKSKIVTSKIDSIALSAKNDKRVDSIGYVSSNLSKPEILIRREDIEIAYKEAVFEDADLRENIEISTVEILRAILEKSNRLWEFVWHGNRISAPVVDESFYKKFIDHRITVAPGDKFSVKMKIIQKKDKGSGIFINSKYEIVEVIEHIPRNVEKEFEE